MHLSVAATDPVYASAEKFVELVEAKTDGKVTFELYPSSSLGVTSDCGGGAQIVADLLAHFAFPHGLEVVNAGIHVDWSWHSS